MGWVTVSSGPPDGPWMVMVNEKASSTSISRNSHIARRVSREISRIALELVVDGGLVRVVTFDDFDDVPGDRGPAGALLDHCVDLVADLEGDDIGGPERFDAADLDRGDVVAGGDVFEDGPDVVPHDGDAEFLRVVEELGDGVVEAVDLEFPGEFAGQL